MSFRTELRKGINRALASFGLRINEPEVKPTEINADISTGLESDILFQADDKIYKKALSDCKVYGEYGCGQSSVWAARNSNCHIISVDTSLEWIGKVKSLVAERSNLDLFHINLGPIAGWGRPKSYDKIEEFHKYTDTIWTQDKKPDLVLIDGRFRVCCFFTCLKLAEEGTVIIFDDYKPRAHYKIIEKFLKPVETGIRQAKFVVPSRNEIDVKACEKLIIQFRCVFD